VPASVSWLDLITI